MTSWKDTSINHQPLKSHSGVSDSGAGQNSYHSNHSPEVMEVENDPFNDAKSTDDQHWRMTRKRTTEEPVTDSNDQASPAPYQRPSWNNLDLSWNELNELPWQAKAAINKELLCGGVDNGCGKRQCVEHYVKEQ